MKREDIPDVVIALLLVAAFFFFCWNNGERIERPLTEKEWAEDVLQNTEYVNEGPSDWRKNIPVVGPDSTSTKHLSQ